MTTDVQRTGRLVRCPVCADDFLWPGRGSLLVFDEGTAQYEPLDVSRLGEAKRAGARRSGYVRCPNPAGDMAPHYLPATYGDYENPLIIGLVGAPMAGKTHLLTAMIREAYRGGLDAYGIRTSALDFRRHNSFHQEFVQPFERGSALPGTSTGITEAADILLLRRGTAGDRPVTFFDVAGEDLESTEALNRSTRFLLGANAVIFVHALEDAAGGESLGAVNSGWSFELAVERLLGVSGNADRVPAAIAVTKADRLRYVPPVDDWLRRPGTALNAARIRDESRDAYAFLHRQGAAGSLRPFEAFHRCTLHFVSASGGDAAPVEPSGRTGERRFPRGVRPAHVLAPLVAILAMTGVIEGPEAAKVGLP